MAAGCTPRPLIQTGSISGGPMISSGKRTCAGICADFRNIPVLLALTAVVMVAAPAFSQTPTLDYSGRTGEKRPELLEQGPAKATPGILLPAPPVPRAQSLQETVVKGVFVRKVNVVGSTAFTQEELDAVTAPYENRTLSMEELESLRRDLTLMYVNKGFINSGAVIPDQAVTDGMLSLQIVEGRLATISVEGNRKFVPSYLQKRIAQGAGTPLNLAPLQDRLQLLQQDQRIQSVHAELRPGAQPGEADLMVRVEENPPMSLWVAFNNYQSPTIGEERGIATFEHQNLTGHGDLFSFTYGISEGLDSLIDTWYLLPVNAYDTTLQFRYRQSEQGVVDDVFGPLDIVSKEKSYELTLRHPFYRSLTQEFAMSLSIGKETNKNSLLGDAFSFSPGEENGRSKVAPLRFGQEWTYRTQRQVVAARSRFSVGLDAFGATTHDDSHIPDGKFFAWLGQLQYARILDLWNIQLLARTDLQLTSDPLLPVEQMGIGGRYSVRGYRENQLVTDRTFIASVETRIPLVENMRWADYLHFCQFIDYGKGSNVELPDPSTAEISSVGLGLRWGASLIRLPFQLRGDAEVYWGYQLRDVDDLDEGLQDDGIHYQFAITGYF